MYEIVSFTSPAQSLKFTAARSLLLLAGVFAYHLGEGAKKCGHLHSLNVELESKHSGQEGLARNEGERIVVGLVVKIITCTSNWAIIGLDHWTVTNAGQVSSQ